jgi:sarcosine oxidase subunit alpha
LNDARIRTHPILGELPPRKEIRFAFNGIPMQGLEGETIAAVLLAQGIRTLRYHEASGRPRGIFCNIGHCMECRVTVDGIDGIRACLTTIKEGMEIHAGRKLPAPLKRGGVTP